MKKRILLLLLCCILLAGCKNKKDVDILKNLSSKINNLNSYNLKGDLEIINGEDMYIYDVEVSYEKEDKFKIYLNNTNNNHTQILLKNPEGVYVLTPSLNKSFKFQSEWPYNNSQIYLYQTILKDIEQDEKRIIEKNQNGYIITSKVNFLNNKELIKQKVYIDNNMNINKIEVLDENNQPKMIMTFTSIDLKPTFDSDYFSLNKNIKESSKTEETVKQVSKIETINYPLYLPANTHLKGQNVINKEDGERVILTFEGDKSFMLIQETSTIKETPETIPVYGEPTRISDTLGILSDKSISWNENGIDYYITSSDLTEEELVNIASSITVLPVSK